MTKDELIAAFRNEVFDTVTPYLWSDEEVDEYADDAQNMFVRLLGGISDATSDLCTIDVAAGDKFVPYDPRILRIKNASRSDGKELDVTNVEDHEAGGVKPALTNTPGTLTGLVLGMDDNNIRLVSIPTVADSVSLVIKRLPLALDLTEIFSHHHIHLLDWMKYRAYNKHDAETFDSAKASDYLGRFTQYCTKVSEELANRQRKPRSVVYGGL